MRKAFGLLFIILSLLAIKNFAFAQQEVMACYKFLYTEKYKNAIEAGKRAIKKYPKNASAHHCLSLAYATVGELKLALEHAKKAERLTSKKTDLLLIYNQIGLINDLMGDSDNALMYYNKSLNLAKDLGSRDMQALLLNNIGLIYFGRGELNKALSSFEDALRLEINEIAKAQTYNNIATIYRTKGDYRRAVEYLQRAIELSERYGKYREASYTKINLGDTYREMKDYEKAEKYLLEGLEGVKKVGDKLSEAVGYIFLGWLYKDKKDYEKAERYLLDGLKGVKEANAKPFEAAVYLLLGSIYKDKKNYELAEKYLLEGIALAKQVGNKLSETLGYRYIGLLYKDRGNKETAKEYLTRAYNLYKSMGAEVYAQEVFLELQELEKGAETLTTSQPEVEACFNFHNARDYKKAVEAGKEAIKKYPNNFKAHYCLGLNYGMLGELKLALEHMKRAESLTSNKRDLMHIYNQIGLIYEKMGYLDDAFLYYSKSLSLAQDLGDKSMQASALNNIAGIYKKKDELDKALGYYEESLRLTTDEKEKAITYTNIAVIYYKKGDYQKALEYFQKVIETSERHGDYHTASVVKISSGDAYRRMKDYKKAEKYLLEGLEGVKKVGDKYWEATAYAYLSLLYKNQGNKAKAEDYFIRAYQLYKSIGAEESAKGILYEFFLTK